MLIKSLLTAAVAALALGATNAAQAGEAVTPTLNQGKFGTTTPQVAYPPICRHDPLFPRYCRRW